MENLFSAEAAIVARIRDQVPDLRTVASASILAGEDDIAKYCPAAFVLPAQGEEVRRADNSVLKVERQYWQVVVAVKNIKDPLDTATAAAEAGKYLAAIRRALWAWEPTTDHMAMIWVDRPAPFYETGYCEFPVLFRTDLKLQSLLP